MKKTLNFCLLAFFVFLLLGCSKSTDPQPDLPGPNTDKISIPILTSYQGDIVITNNTLIISVNGETDLVYYIPPGKDTIIIITGDQATHRKGKPATLTMNCVAINLHGDQVPICYNNNGTISIPSLLGDNQKANWVGQACGISGDEIVIRVKVVYEYQFPGEYRLIAGSLTFGSEGIDQLITWPISANLDTVIVIRGVSAQNRIGKPYWLTMGDYAVDNLGNHAEIGYVPAGSFSPGILLADNPKVEITGHRAN